MKKSFLVCLGGLLSGLVLFSCRKTEEVVQPADKGTPATGQVITSQKQNFVADTLATGLDSPWGLAFLPDGRILVTERKGEIRLVQAGKLSGERIGGVPAVYSQGQGGLLDVQLHPDYARNGWLYLTYAKPGAGGASTALARAKLQGNQLTDWQELFAAQPFVNSGLHFGSRIAFDGKGYVFVSIGERGNAPNAQRLDNHYGKVIRLHDDGRVPTDNPFAGQSDAKPEIWSYGHRNPQGMVYQPETGTLWAHEHGPKGGDEINVITKGKNYGWPTITYGIDYDGTPVSNLTQQAGMEQPVHYWVPSIGPSGMTFVTSDRYPNWRGNLLVGALALRHLARVEVAGTRYVAEEKLFDGLARVRQVAQGPDGYVYVVTEGPGTVIKLIPAQ
ncbi:MAG: PQQ-dependent sugar dehydrogenase [Ferruginibacter sp.]|nr:PQQ-dependent sugar dehydrogenase [Cytophagales bacterium]